MDVVRIGRTPFMRLIRLIPLIPSGQFSRKVGFWWFWSEDGRKRGVGARWGRVLARLALGRKLVSQEGAVFEPFSGGKWGADDGMQAEMGGLGRRQRSPI